MPRPLTLYPYMKSVEPGPWSPSSDPTYPGNRTTTPIPREGKEREKKQQWVPHRVCRCHEIEFAYCVEGKVLCAIYVVARRNQARVSTRAMHLEFRFNLPRWDRTPAILGRLNERLISSKENISKKRAAAS